MPRAITELLGAITDTHGAITEMYYVQLGEYTEQLAKCPMRLMKLSMQLVKCMHGALRGKKPSAITEKHQKVFYTLWMVHSAFSGTVHSGRCAKHSVKCTVKSGKCTIHRSEKSAACSHMHCVMRKVQLLKCRMQERRTHKTFLQNTQVI